MLESFVDHSIVFVENIWDKYPILRPSITISGKIWRIGIKLFRYLARNKNLISYNARQPYLLCYLNEDPIWLFFRNGYEINELAIRDKGEVWSIRKLVQKKIFQVHIRFYTPPENEQFRDKYKFELRSHFEYSWESHPILHFKAVGFKPAVEEVLNILKTNGVDYVEADRANEQFELEKHLQWIQEKLNYAKSLRGRRKRTTKKNRK